MWNNFKSFTQNMFADQRMFLVLLMVSIAITAFGLGRLAERYTTIVPKLPKVELVQLQELSEQEAVTQVVASKNGTKYHLPWCAGAQQMNEANKIFFDTIEAAQAAGYSAASNCKGLK